MYVLIDELWIRLSVPRPATEHTPCLLVSAYRGEICMAATRVNVRTLSYNATIWEAVAKRITTTLLRTCL